VRGKRIERTVFIRFTRKSQFAGLAFPLDINGLHGGSTGLGLDSATLTVSATDPGTPEHRAVAKTPDAQLLMTCTNRSQPFFADPAGVLANGAQVRNWADHLAAFELEFYLIDQDNVNGRPQSPRSAGSGSVRSDQVYMIDDLGEYVGLPASSSKAPKSRASR